MALACIPTLPIPIGRLAALLTLRRCGHPGTSNRCGGPLEQDAEAQFEVWNPARAVAAIEAASIPLHQFPSN